MGAAACLLARRRIQGGLSRRAAVLLFCMYAGGMAAITLAPEPGWLLSALRGAAAPYFNLGGLAHRVSLRPFSQLDGPCNLAGNVVMFLPFGFFAALLWRGYARESLRLTLEKCREAGEERVLVTCDKKNIALAKTILANGDALANEVADQLGLGKSGVIPRYWITL